MPRLVVLLAGWTLCLTAGGGAQQSPASPQAAFRSGIDLIQLDVSVLDHDRQPVRGLTTGDFTVLVDGQPRPVVAFRAVELPPPAAEPSAPWVRDAAPDIVTNTRPSGRVVVIVIDDGSFQQADPESASAGFSTPVADIRAIEKAREIARSTVQELRPDDLAAVVFTENNYSAQSFTRDRARLLSAIDKAALSPSPSLRPARPLDGAGAQAQADMFNDPDNIMRPACPCGTCSIQAVGRVAASLATLPQQRKIVVYVSAGVPLYSAVRLSTDPILDSYQIRRETCNAERKKVAADVFRQAALSNVTIQSIDPKGLVLGVVATGGNPLENAPASRMEFLRAVAETTGGRAVVNNNDMEREVPAVLAESSSYYLLGVEAPQGAKDGQFHALQVRVNRPDVDVRTRSGFFTPTAAERKAMAASPGRGLDASIEGVLPKAELPLVVSAAPFADGNRKPALAIVLNVTQPAGTPIRGRQRVEIVDVLATAFNQETGRSVGSRRQRANVVLLPTDAPDAQYEVLARLPVQPGRYEIRVGVEAAGRTASVYGYADVPDFASDDVSLSGLVLSSAPSPRSAPRDAFLDLMPLAPTAWRTFGTTDRVAAFLRIYQGGSRSIVPVSVTTRITDARNDRIVEDVTTIDAAAFSRARAADHRVNLPLTTLRSGEYLLTVDVTAGDKRAQRWLRFRLR